MAPRLGKGRSEELRLSRCNKQRASWEETSASREERALQKGRETGSLQFSLDRNEVSAPYHLDTSVNLSNKSSLVGN